MTALMHKFPGMGAAPLPPLEKAITFEPFDPLRTKDLYLAAHAALTGSESLLDFIDTSRDLARQAGIESIGIEILAIMQGSRFSRVIDALSDSVQKNGPVSLSREGLGTLRRVEALIAEAGQNLKRFSDGDFTIIDNLEARARYDADYHKACLAIEESRMDGIRKEHGAKARAASRQAEGLATLRSALGATRPGSPHSLSQGKPPDFELWIPFAILGVIAVAATVVAVVVAKK